MKIKYVVSLLLGLTFYVGIAQSIPEVPILGSFEELAYQVADAQKVFNDKGQIKYFHKMDHAYLVSYVPDQPNGASIIICPGGGYKWLNVLNAGYMAERLIKMGITAFVLVHRLPDGTEALREVAFEDAARAISKVKRISVELGLDENRVGLLGSSAGGHVAAMTVGLQVRNQDTSMKPDFLVLAWPVISMKSAYTHLGSRERLLGSTPSSWEVLKYSAEEYVTEHTPPTFLVHANDDRSVSPVNSLEYYRALLQNQVPSELHIYESGGHGFGMHPSDEESWFNELEKWLQKIELL